MAPTSRPERRIRVQLRARRSMTRAIVRFRQLLTSALASLGILFLIPYLAGARPKILHRTDTGRRSEAEICRSNGQQC